MTTTTTTKQTVDGMMDEAIEVVARWIEKCRGFGLTVTEAVEALTSAAHGAPGLDTEESPREIDTLSEERDRLEIKMHAIAGGDRKAYREMSARHEKLSARIDVLAAEIDGRGDGRPDGDTLVDPADTMDGCADFGVCGGCGRGKGEKHAKGCGHDVARTVPRYAAEDAAQRADAVKINAAAEEAAKAAEVARAVMTAIESSRTFRFRPMSVNDLLAFSGVDTPAAARIMYTEHDHALIFDVDPEGARVLTLVFNDKDEGYASGSCGYMQLGAVDDRPLERAEDAARFIATIDLLGLDVVALAKLRGFEIAPAYVAGTTQDFAERGE